MVGRILKLEDAPKGDRLIVCGGRNYGKPLSSYPDEETRRRDAIRVDAERKILVYVLDLLAPSEIAQGDAPGADTLAREWAQERNVPCARYRALWETEGRAAGFLRNKRMFHGFKGNGTVAFPGGNGTTNMENVTIDGDAYLVRVKIDELRKVL